MITGAVIVLAVIADLHRGTWTATARRILVRPRSGRIS
jgi:hypothetical protein